MEELTRYAFYLGLGLKFNFLSILSIYTIENVSVNISIFIDVGNVEFPMRKTLQGLPEAQFLIGGPRIRKNGRVRVKIKRKHLMMALLIGGILCVILGCILSIRLQISKERFGIYLLENDELVLSEEDIISYNKTSYEIKLNEEGVKKIKTLNVPVSGIPFVIKINDKEMYKGAFWSPVSSKSYSGIVILFQDNSIKIETGYPSSEFFVGLDPRNNFEIIEYFQKVEKLVQ